MQKIFYIVFLLTAFCSGSLYAEVRESAVSGAFYPADKEELKKQVEGFISNADIGDAISLSGDVIGLIAPHAGYAYSGKVAGYAFKAIEGRSYDTVIIIGSNHRVWGYDKISIYKEGVFKTPLGNVEIDSEYAGKIIEAGGFAYDTMPHKDEHSVEVEIPFLQTVLKDFKIIPIVMGDYRKESCERLAKSIWENKGNRGILVVASTDLSHDKKYYQAVNMDKLGLDLIAKLDINGLIEAYDTGKTEMCGYGPVLTLMYIAKDAGNTKGILLKYLNSGDVTCDIFSRIVGYGVVVFVKEGDNSMKEKKDDKSEYYTQDERRALLELARKSILDFLNTGKTGSYPVSSPKFNEKRGVFVTLNKSGELRGCIGYIEPIKSLQEAVIDNAVNAATNDYRFSRVETSELPKIDIEISVLTPPSEIKGPEEFIVGEHGIIIRKGFRSAVFLPQVAPEQGWGMEETLSHLCMKAGMPPDEWKKPGMQFSVFTAEVFGEKE